MFTVANENGMDSQQTLVASQNLDELLNIKMNEYKQNLMEIGPKKLI